MKTHEPGKSYDLFVPLSLFAGKTPPGAGGCSKNPAAVGECSSKGVMREYSAAERVASSQIRANGCERG